MEKAIVLREFPEERDADGVAWKNRLLYDPGRKTFFIQRFRNGQEYAVAKIHRRRAQRLLGEAGELRPIEEVVDQAISRQAGLPYELRRRMGIPS